jgi:hypothetical protein
VNFFNALALVTIILALRDRYPDGWAATYGERDDEPATGVQIGVTKRDISPSGVLFDGPGGHEGFARFCYELQILISVTKRAMLLQCHSLNRSST